MSGGPMTFRGRGVNPRPPEAGVYGSMIIQVLRKDTTLCWPVGQLIEAAGLSPKVGWLAVQRLYALSLIEKRPSDEPVIRVRLSARGRRYRLRSERLGRT